MLNPRLASRYAKSIIDIATEQNSLEETFKDMQFIEAVCQQNRDFVSMMRSPIIKADKKTAIIQAVFEGRLSALSLTFIKLLISKGREQNIDEIAIAFIQQYRFSKKIRKVTLTTASPVDSSVVNILHKKLLEVYSDGSVEIDTLVDPSLIGGFVLNMGDQQMDASIARDLNDIRKQFAKNYYVPQM